MVFGGGFRRRRGFGPYGQPPGYGYGSPPGYGYRGSSCGRDLCLVESGCCLAEALGCGPHLGLLAPALVRRSMQAARHPDGSGPWRQRVLLAAIRLYQAEISPQRAPVCRFSPTCSHYAAEAVRTYGVGRGGWLAVRRLIRCRPGVVGGQDPVP